MSKHYKTITASCVFIATIVAANTMTDRFGLVSIGFGLMVTAGTFAAGAALISRDWVQQAGPAPLVPILIAVGALASALTANPALALASGLAFAISELVDWGVFTPLRSRGIGLAVLASSTVAAPVDTILFLHLAGFGVTWNAVLGQFIVKTAMAALVALTLSRKAIHAIPVGS